MIESFTIFKRYTFTTSLEVVREVMNVPMEAIHAIARMNGISTADNHERNISEKELHPFIEAFERKTRNYFVNSIRNSAQLSPQELQTFTEFCKTFKKGNVSLDKVSNWSHIGKTKLRQYFVEKIKEKTPSLRTNHAIHDLFAGCSAIDAALEAASKTYSDYINYSAISKLVFADIQFGYGSKYSSVEHHQQSSQDLLCRIVNNWRYHSQIKSEVCLYQANRVDLVKRFVLSARYYIYVDDDDHLYDTVEKANNANIVNRTLKMAA